MSARSTKEFKTKEDNLYINYQRIFSQFQERMRTAVAGIGNPALQLSVALETTLTLCNDFQKTVLLPYQESHALSPRTLQSLLGANRLYPSFLEEILHWGNQEGVFRGIVQSSARDRLQTSAEPLRPRHEVHDG